MCNVWVIVVLLRMNFYNILKDDVINNNNNHAFIISLFILVSPFPLLPVVGRPFTGSFFPNGNGSIFMNNLGCYGDEGYLAHCHYQDNVIGCSHRGNEVGVRCYQSGNMLERCSDYY